MATYWIKNESGIITYAIEKDNGDKWQITIGNTAHSANILSIDNLDRFDSSDQSTYESAVAIAQDFLNEAQ